MNDQSGAILEYMKRCLRPGEQLEVLERVTVADASGAPPLLPGDPHAWLGFTKARLITYYEGSRSVRSHRLGDLTRLELKEGPFKRQLIWQAAESFDGEAATISKGFARAAETFVNHRSQWVPVQDATTTCVTRVEPIEDPNLAAVARKHGLGTELKSAYCVVCGAWCGGVNDDGTLQTDECGACLRRITGAHDASGSPEALP